MIAFIRSVVSGIGFRGVFPEGVVVSDLENPIIRGEFERFPPYINKQVAPASEWGNFKLYKTNVMGDERDIDMIYPLLKEKYGERIGVTRSASFMVELVPKGVTKAVALKELVESYFDRPMTLCCVGDYDNDIEMLEAADISACPENANDNVKALAKLHLCSNDDGVIGDLVDWLDKNI
jgi:hydroxymethylpyrimidine pyrophosphatase-like HAD family hydrolase